MNRNQITHSPATPADAARMTASWPDLLNTQIQTQEQARRISAEAESLMTPASKAWIAGRVATLLSQYFVSSVPVEVMAAIADDWNEELRAYPGWAIQNAARWWMGADNDKRRQKPMPGDIAARCRIELGVVDVARLALGRFEEGRAAYQQAEPHVPCDKDTANKIVEMAGFALKRFGGAS